MDRLTSMAVFVRVVDKGSFAAASASGITPAMVAKHIRFLEDRLGARLLNRTTRRQSLTEIGRAYVERCRSILAEVEAAEASADTGHGVPRGTLRITAPVAFGSERLAPALVDYLALYPEISLDLALNDRAVDLVEEGFDAALRVGPLSDSSLIARPLAPYRILACAAPSYLAKHGRPETVAGLASHSCLGFAHWAPGNLWTFKGPDGECGVRVTTRLRMNNGAALRAAAIAGAGILLQSEAILAQAIADGRLVPVLPNYPPLSRPMHLIWHPDRRLTPKLRTFIDFIVERFA